jgi:ferredoxin
LKAVSIGCGIPWDICYDNLSVVPVGGMVGHPEGLEAFPCPALRVPKIFDSGAARIGNGASFTEIAYSQGVTSRVEDERIVENGLFENLCVGCGFGLC